MELTFREIAEAVSGRILTGELTTVFASFHNHSDDAVSDSFYICIKGARVDGHDFLPAIYKAGCKGALITDESAFNSLRESIPGMCVLLVDDVVVALASLGKYVISRLHPRIVAITGSVGKTSTKEMTAAMLAMKYRVGHSPGNLNTEIGLPLTLLNFEGDEEIVVLEMATRGFGQIAHLCRIAPPDIAMITTIGHSHIECFGNIEGVRTAKMEIVEYMTEGGTAIIFGDDPALVDMAKASGKQLVTFGESEFCDYRLDGIDVTTGAVEFKLHHDGNVFDGAIQDGSRGDAFNCAAAVAVAHMHGISIEDALSTVESFEPVGMRLDRRVGPRGSLMLLDCYNANPESMRNAIEVATSARRENGRVIVVLGDMLELGELSIIEHELLGAELVKSGVDSLLSYGKEIGVTGAKFKVSGKEVFHYENHKEIAEWLMAHVTEKDVILIKGSRGMMLEKVLEFLNDEA